MNRKLQVEHIPYFFIIFWLFITLCIELGMWATTSYFYDPFDMRILASRLILVLCFMISIVIVITDELNE